VLADEYPKRRQARGGAKQCFAKPRRTCL